MRKGHIFYFLYLMWESRSPGPVLLSQQLAFVNFLPAVYKEQENVYNRTSNSYYYDFSMPFIKY